MHSVVMLSVAFYSLLCCISFWWLSLHWVPYAECHWAYMLQ